MTPFLDIHPPIAALHRVLSEQTEIQPLGQHTSQMYTLEDITTIMRRVVVAVSGSSVLKTFQLKPTVSTAVHILSTQMSCPTPIDFQDNHTSF